MTNRTTAHENKKSTDKRDLMDFSKFKEQNSYNIPIYNTPPPSEGCINPQRISQKQLEEIASILSDRDRQILHSLRHYRYLFTDQIQRLHFTSASSSAARLRATSRNLKKLRELGLVATLSRRIGGVRAGSTSMVWYLTHAGERLLRLHNKATHPYRKFFEPSPYFLAHTLAVSETAIQVVEACHKNKDLELTALQLEPECHRSYSDRGVILSLQPDLFIVTRNGEYEDRWFFEIDLDTESPAKVLEKCEKYHRYYHSGLEQAEFGVFPVVIWLVPNKRRQESILTRLKESFVGQPRLFAVITPDELALLLRHGLEGVQLC